MVRYSCLGHILSLLIPAARGESDLKLLCYHLCIVSKGFVEIAHPEEDQSVLVLFLCLVILAHGRCHLVHSIRIFVYSYFCFFIQRTTWIESIRKASVIMIK